MNLHARLIALAAALALPASAALAEPTFDNFGPLPEATFGGTGIPNDHVAISTRTFEIVEDEPITLTLGLTAHQRFDNPPLSHDGAGTFTATTGTSFSPGGLEGALWNFAFFVGVEGATIEQLVAEDYNFLLAFDFDPGAAVDPGIILLNLATGNVVQGSQNLLFGFLAEGIPGIVFPPSGSFDPNAPGLFSFTLTAINTISGVHLTSSIDVRVVPVPATALLFGFGLAGLAVARRRRKG